MKKLVLTLIGTAGLASYSFGQGVIFADGSAGTKTEINGVVNSTQDINAELLYNNGSGFVPLVTFLLSQASGNSAALVLPGATEPAAGDITFNGDGTFYDSNGNAYETSPFAGGTTVTFEMQGWLGNYSSLAAAGAALQPIGVTATFTEVVNDAANPTGSTLNNLPLLNLVSVPEPATFALAGLGIASLLAFRRRK